MDRTFRQAKIYVNIYINTIRTTKSNRHLYNTLPKRCVQITSKHTWNILQGKIYSRL